MNTPADPLREALDNLPIYAWASVTKPLAIHHAVKDLWLKVSPKRVENYIEPLVLLEDVRAALATKPAEQPEWRQPQEHATDAPGWLARRLAESGVGAVQPPAPEPRPLDFLAAHEKAAQFWQEEARRYAENANYWREKYEVAADGQAKATPPAREQRGADPAVTQTVTQNGSAPEGAL